jgi:hypothetical protein
MPMFRACDSPAADSFRRACTLMKWETAASLGTAATVDWSRNTEMATVPLPLFLVLPADALGPIRDWGLAAPAEPEAPPEPVHEDFAAGLANWITTNADWRQDIAGVRTGSLALLRPSLGMCDYELEFLGKIENQSIGWVFRAANTSTYHAVQIVLDASGAAHLVRFSVLGGEREHPAIAPLAHVITKSSSCRVRMSVRGCDFQIFVNDKPAGAWSDDRLSEGGIGFFSDGEDSARLYWVKISPESRGLSDHHYAPMAHLHSDLHHEISIAMGD